MEIFPAIDLKDGNVVRLLNGDYKKVDVYSTKPLEVLKNFKASGARNIHLVDLDGALGGVPTNYEIIRELTKTGGLFVQVGGGVRDERRIVQYLDAGASRVILGTAAVKDYQFTKEAAGRYGNKIAVAVDSKNGFAAINGWTEISDIASATLCERLRDIGVTTVIYTDISRDGALKGADISTYETLSKIEGLNIIASGGISFEDEIATLRDLGIYGAILGRALYTGALSLNAALKIAKGGAPC
jgi:phosphoribosylformimino-5-aminoimidazole carboxamide ribotide isomerase